MNFSGLLPTGTSEGHGQNLFVLVLRQSEVIYGLTFKIGNSCVYLLCYLFVARYTTFLFKIVMTKF